MRLRVYSLLIFMCIIAFLSYERHALINYIDLNEALYWVGLKYPDDIIYISPNGDDGNCGLSCDKAVATFDMAFKKMQLMKKATLILCSTTTGKTEYWATTKDKP